MSATVAVGQTVELNDGRPALVRFVGATTFAPGHWVGVELDDFSGKNDGSVQGLRYFDCEMGKGMFLRMAAIARVLDEPARAPEAVLSNPPLEDEDDEDEDDDYMEPEPEPEPDTEPEQAPAPQAFRASVSGVRRVARPPSLAAGPSKQTTGGSDPNLGRRMSINAPSPTPAPRPARAGIRSAPQSPTKQPQSGPSSRTVTPSSSRPIVVAKTRPSAGPRTSMAPPPVPAAKPRQISQSISSISRSSAAPAPPRPSGSRLSMSAGRVTPTVRVPSYTARRQSEESQAGPSAAEAQISEEDEMAPFKSEAEILSPQPQSPVGSRATAQLQGNRVASGPGRPAASTAASREVEDLKAKLRVLERKRMEDRDRLRLLKTVQAERDKYAAIIQKLQAKYHPQQQENAELKRLLKEAESRLESIEQLQAEHDDEMELATLDREMAEEQAENYKLELDTLKTKVEEMELELEVAREENTELSKGMSPEERSSMGWLQMERNNERLREALIKLRELTQMQEEELREKVKTLEEDLTDYGVIRDKYDEAKEKLHTIETVVEDLRQQLDDALGAETMIEELTERNGAMTERIEELKAVIDDLESLKEINDDLELNHIQNEKELQEEINFKDNIIAEQARRSSDQEQALEDMEYTLHRFRDLVTSLQSDLEDMRASNAVTESEQEKLNDRSRAMMDLNLKLQLSATKAQVKTIDLELRRLDAQESKKHLELISVFLPDTYKDEQDAVLALLRFLRIGFKATLVQSFIKDRVSGNSHAAGHEDDVLEGYDAMDKLVWIASMCDRFINSVSHGSVQDFARYRAALPEVEPVERALNGWIEALRRDELKERQCVEELRRLIAIMSHLASIHIGIDLPSYADETIMKVSVVQSHLDTAVLALTTVRTMVQHAVLPVEDEDEDLGQFFAKTVEAVVSQTRNAKVTAGKVLRSLEELKARSLALLPETGRAFEAAEVLSRELAAMSRRIGLDLHTLLHDEARPETESPTYNEVQDSIRASVTKLTSSDDLELFSTYLDRLKALTGQVSDLAMLSSDLEQTQEFDVVTEPWKLRSEELRAIETVPASAEEELRRVRDELREANRSIRQAAEDRDIANLRIERLESRMRDAQTNAARAQELESHISEIETQSLGLKEDIEKQDRELKTLETDRDKWKKMASDSQAFADGADAASIQAGQERAVAAAHEMQALRDKMEGLQSAVRFLREDNLRARTTEQHKYDWLAEPLASGPCAAERRRVMVAAEGKDVLGELLRMATSPTAGIYDLSTLPKDKLAWRPAKSTPRYHAAKQMEEYATWKAWQDSVVRKSETVLALERHQSDVAASKKKKARRAAAAKEVAQLQIRLLGYVGDNKPLSAREARIHGSKEWEALQGRAIGA